MLECHDARYALEGLHQHCPATVETYSSITCLYFYKQLCSSEAILTKKHYGIMTLHLQHKALQHVEEKY